MQKGARVHVLDIKINKITPPPLLLLFVKPSEIFVPHQVSNSVLSVIGYWRVSECSKEAAARRGA